MSRVISECSDAAWPRRVRLLPNLAHHRRCQAASCSPATQSRPPPTLPSSVVFACYPISPTTDAAKQRRVRLLPNLAHHRRGQAASLHSEIQRNSRLFFLSERYWRQAPSRALLSLWRDSDHAQRTTGATNNFEGRGDDKCARR